MRAKRIALSGYYGFRNAGDEAVLAGLIRGLRSSPGGGTASLDICALSIDPAATQSEHAILAAHRYKIGPLLRTLSWCDLLASGGGSLLQDVTSKHSIFYYLGVIRAAQIMGKKTMFIAQGIGPLNIPRSRRLTAAVANRCNAITVRDPASAALLQQIGATKPIITTTADPALLLGLGSYQQSRTGAAISLRPWHDSSDDLPNTVASACAQVIKSPIVSSMLMSPDDAPVHDAFFDHFNSSLGIAQGLPHEGTAPTWDVLSQVAASTGMVVGMRLHALILAVANAAPVVALSYDPKINAFMEQTGQADAVYDIRSPDLAKLSAMISMVWEQRNARAQKLQEILPKLELAALTNAEVALSLL